MKYKTCELVTFKMGDAQNQQLSQKIITSSTHKTKGNTTLKTQTLQTLRTESTCTGHNIILKITINETSCYYLCIDDDLDESVILFQKRNDETKQCSTWLQQSVVQTNQPRSSSMFVETYKYFVCEFHIPPESLTKRIKPKNTHK